MEKTKDCILFLFTLVHIGSNGIRSIKKQKQKRKKLNSLIKCDLSLVEVWPNEMEAVSKVRILFIYNDKTDWSWYYHTSSLSKASLVV